MVFLWYDVVGMPLMAWNCERNWDGNPGALPEGGDTDSSLLTLRETADVWGVTSEIRMCLVGGKSFQIFLRSGFLWQDMMDAYLLEVPKQMWRSGPNIEGLRELGTILLMVWSCKLGSPSGIGSIPRTKFDFISRDWLHQRLHVFESQAMWVPIQKPWYAVYSNWGN